MSKVGDNIKRLRHKATQDTLAKMTGLQPCAISHFECGRRNPSMENLIKLADALDVTIDELVGRKKSKDLE